MITFLIRRLMIGVATLFLITVIVFGLISVAPGGPAAIMSMTTTATVRSQLNKQYGLNQPVPVRYAEWLGSAVRGNLGQSYDFGEPVSTVIMQRLPNTVILAGTALVLSIIIGVPLGIWAAMFRGRWLDTAVSSVSTLGLSVPDFWLATLLIIVFAVFLHWLPASGMYSNSGGALLSHLVMPAVVLTIAILPNIVRFTRSNMVNVLGQDYIRTARSKGLRRSRVFYKHALRNAMVPILSLVGLLAAALFGGSAVVETVFAWPGIGRLTVQAATDRDYPLIMGVTLLVSTIVIVANLVTDLLYAVLDPRIRYG